MTIQRRVLGPASVRFNDYVGTAAADDADAVLQRPSLYELADIDRDQWTILGIDMVVNLDKTQVTVYAVDRSQHGLTTAAAIVELGRTRGEVPVSAFELPQQRVEDFINDAFKAISLRLVARDLHDQVLVVAAGQD